MEQDLKSIGFDCAFTRTMIWGLLLLFPALRIMEFWDGNLNSILFYVIIMIVMLTIIVYSWICALSGGPFRDVKAFCNQSDNPNAMMARLEQNWRGAAFKDQTCRISDEYLIYSRKMVAVVILLRDIYGIKYEGGITRIYLKDNTLLTLRIREKERRLVENHIANNTTGIALGKAAAARLLETVVGKINTRYRVVKIQTRYFIVDFANPSKLSSYLSFGEKYRFSERGANDFWHAWEISEEELHNIKYKPFKEQVGSSGVAGNIMIGSVLGLSALLRYSPISDILPIYDFVGGQFWIVGLSIISIFLIFFVFVNATSNFNTKKYTEVRISRKEALYTKHQLFQYVIMRILILIPMLFFIGMAFFGNFGLLWYIQMLFCLFLYVSVGLWFGFPIISSQSTVEKIEK